MKKLISFLIGVFLFSVLPVIGWGIGNAEGFFQNEARFTYVVMMAGLSLLVVAFVPESGQSRGQGEQPMKQHWLSLLVLQIIPVLILLAAPFCDRRELATFGESNGLRYAGVLAVLAGFGLMNWAVIALDRQFSIDITLQKDHKLVTQGPYSRIRHPRYVGILIFLAGISLVFRCWIGLAGITLLVPVFLWRIRDEETLMHREFGEEWLHYKSKTGRLLPKLF